MTTVPFYAQKNSLSQTELINYHLTHNSINKAKKELNNQIKYFTTKKLYDSLYKYPYYLAKIEQHITSTQTAVNKAEKFARNIISKTSNNKTKYKTLLSLVDFYDEIGENHKSIETTKEALVAVKNTKNIPAKELAKVQYNLGASYLTLNNIDKASYYFRKALKNYKKSPTTSKQKLSDAYNAMGAIMWMSTKPDSAKHYYQKAIKNITQNKGDSIQNLYLATVIQSNISLLEYSQGNINKAMIIQKKVINNYQKVIQNTNDEITKNKAQRYQARALSNLAVFYNSIGNLQKAYEILNYSYQVKKTFLEPSDKELTTTLINIGEAQLSLQEHQKAVKTLDKALNQLNNSPVENNYWKATALFAKAEAQSALNNIPEAKKLYTISENLFEKSLGSNYDKAYLNFLQSKALFLSKNKEPNLANQTALKAYQYAINNTENKISLQVIELAVTRSKVFYNNKQYKLSKKWAIKAKELLNKRISTLKNKIDSVRTEFTRPDILLLEVKSNLELTQKKDKTFYNTQLTKLQKAIRILEQRKTTTLQYNDINILFSQYKEVYNITKKLYLELYQLTEKPYYLYKTIGILESSIYNKIRTRLNTQNNLTIKSVPKKILEREKKLKKEINNCLTTSSSTIDDFFKATENWKYFLDTIRITYPQYYKLRYQTIEKPLNNIEQTIPKNTTVIRYFFVEQDLYAYLVSKESTEVIKLNTYNQKNTVDSWHKKQPTLNETSSFLYNLYKQLWKPFEDKITTENIIIIPDEELFNISFEILTPTKIKNYTELNTNSLLAKYNISYNYSLLLVNSNVQQSFKQNFIAFTPEFPDKMKQDYIDKMKDTTFIDKSYLSLLQQPFSVSLAKKYSKLFNGKSLINNSSTKTNFKKYAGNHSILHIGTHAISNNINPGLSQLIFAKDFTDTISIDNNLLFTYEIYNYNLNANLTVLTACETGKPSFQSGEGMISLSHAFNFAGSRSIVTSLWKIDEQSSNQIIDLFYENIAKGLSKDKALKKAKLSYLSLAKGRTIHPHYWAGLILVGDTSPLTLTSSNNNYYFTIIVFVIFIIMMFALLLKKRKKRLSDKITFKT